MVHTPRSVAIDNSVEKFFRTSGSVDPLVLAVRNRMLREQERTPYVGEFVKSAGYPIWNKAVLTTNKINSSARFQLPSSNSPVVIVPFAKPGEIKTSAFVVAVLGANDTIMRTAYHFQYKNLPYFTGRDTGMTAEKAAITFMALDRIVFNHKKFFVRDTLLFGETGATPTKFVTMDDLPSFSKLELEICIDVTDGSSDCNPGSTPVPTTPGPGQCGPGTMVRRVCYTFELNDDDWWSGGGGDPGPGNPGGGPGGTPGNPGGTPGGDPGGPGPWNENPCRVDPLDGGDPCGGNVPPGWDPVYQNIYDEAWFNNLAPYTVDVSALNQDPCMKDIINATVALNNSTISAINDLYSESAKYNLKFVKNPSIPGSARTHVLPPTYTQVNGQFQKLVKLDVEIQLNQNYFNVSTKFYWAESIIHEMIHAYFHYRSIDANGDPAKEQLLEQELSFIKPWDPNNPNSNPSNQHEQMATNYVEKIVVALKEYRLLSNGDIDPWRVDYPNITLDDYYRAMAWGGLTREQQPDGSFTYVTLGWKAFENNNPAKALMYRKIIQAEQLGTSMAVSNDKCP